MAHLGHPVIGDDTYGDKKLNGFLRKNTGIDRQMLHAYKISFNHPTKKVPVTFMARLREDMVKLLKDAPVEKWYKK
jgi:23S rRNA-/tRNA-specific pseudouridylate synthase